MEPRYGEVVDVNLVRDKGTGKSKGFAFLAYEDQRSTNLAVGWSLSYDFKLCVFFFHLIICFLRDLMLICLVMFDFWGLR